MKFIISIPARGGSKRLPHKNILPLAGKPLILHTIDYAKHECPDIPIYVSTDDSEIEKISQTAGVNVIKRPKELSGDFVSTSAVLQHVHNCVIDERFDYDYMILLQCTNPLRPSGMITDAIQKIVNDDRKSLVGITPTIQKLGKIVKNQFVPWNYIFGQRSQDMEPLYYENGLLYISHKSLIAEGKIIDGNPFPYIIDSLYAKVDIDTKDDFDLAEHLLLRQK